ncbi:SDR family NAD(P)-dependent oxidoreductase [Eleftheria terrae]|uniref:SDR family NAD(P)-dependent oxidoreductase n=1 Tax=Eleftheria terrae TaxID=1597781 RepID=UPI00263BAA77|nr:SDR family NAD(P)-dependent oxidoreductase [Eleftheria terrae]WKB56130.1 SDR family NAD(P)-dependent oxidoreductase [Eleftheria terrae]
MKEQLAVGMDNPIVRDHRVLGQHLLPGLAYIDVLFQVFRDHGHDHRTIELSNVAIYRPLVVSTAQPVQLEIEAVEAEPGHWRVSVEGGGQRYLGAEVRRVEPAGFDEVIDLASIASAAQQSIPLETLYAACREVELVHGEFMQAQGTVYVSPEAIHVECRLGEEALALAPRLMFHPALIDASAVGAGGARAALDAQGEPQLALPIYYGSFRATDLLQTHAFARLRHASSRDTAELRYYTLDFFDASGRKVAELRDFASKQVRDASMIDPARAVAAGPATTEPPAASAPAARSDDAGFRRLLQRLIGDKLGVPPQQLDPAAGYYELGLNSVALLELVGDIEREAGASLPPTLLFEHVTIEQLAAHLAQHHRAAAADGPAPDETGAGRAATPAEGGAVPNGDEEVGDRLCARCSEQGLPGPVRRGHEPIAIVGMAGRFPEADNIDAFWENLKFGKDGIREIPESRWDWRRFASMRSPTGKHLSRWGGFIDDVDCFDAQFFRISPREAEHLDPQERLFLQTCWEAIEDAGYTPATLTGGAAAPGAVGVFAGVMHKDYALIANEAQRPGQSVPFSQSNAAIANRVSYVCDFHGPSVCVDTVCSSSLIAVHLALQSLRTGECSVALAGGVNLSLHPAKYQAYGSMDMHASDGRCRSFGRGGDGYVSSEAVAAVLLKPLSRAIEQHDHVYAVIRGSSTNHVGAVSGFTVPSPGAQADLIAACLEGAGVDARSVSYVEAHGTGTSLGDPIEIEGLCKAYSRHTEDRQFCAIGSVKSNIGHAESAAGVCGLIKVALQLHHATLVPSLYAEPLNPLIDFASTPFRVQQCAQPWPRPMLETEAGIQAGPRIAGLSSFGASGSNAHLVLQEHEPPPRPPAGRLEPALVVLSAKSAPQLRAQAARLRDHLRSHRCSDADLADIAYTLQVGRVAMDHRLAVVVSSVDQLVALLDDVVAGRRHEDILLGQARRRDDSTMFSADDDVEGLVAAWLSKRKLRKLASVWVQGLGIDWNRLHVDARPLRVSLPTYPFARERYWLEAPLPLPQADGAVPDPHAALHPLVQRNTSTLVRQRYSSTFTPAAFFLADHRVHGAAVLPGVAYLEMARAAVLASMEPGPAGATEVELRNVVWLQPLVVHETTQLHIGLSPQDGGDVDFEVYSSPHGEAAPDATIVHAQGRATCRTAAVVPPAGPPLLDLADLRLRCEGQLEVAGCYETLRAMQIEHGPAFRGLRQLRTGTDAEGGRFVLADIELPACVHDTAQAYLLHPSVLDSALQAALGFAMDGTPGAASGAAGQTALPFALERLQIWAASPAEATVVVRAATAASAVASPGAPVQKLDFDLCDREGRVCVRLQGVASRALAGEAIGALAPHGRSSVQLWTPGWAPSALIAADTAAAPAHHWVLLAPHHANQLGELAACCPSVQWAALPGPADASTVGWYAQLGERVFERVQALLQHKPRQPVLLQVLVAPDEDHDAIFGALSGVLKSAHHENPRFFGQLLAVQQTRDSEGLAERVLREAQAALQGEAEVRDRQGQREVARFEPAGPVDRSAAVRLPWRDRGVYLITGGAGGLGMVMANEILRQVSGARIVLTGRSRLDEDRQAALAALAGDGAAVEYRVMDVSDAAAVDRVIRSVVEQHGRLNGIVHSAGVIRDSFILSKQPAEFHEVLAPKVAGTWHLDLATRAVELDFLLLFSSAAGALGNVGQCDYAMANAYMDRYAAYRNRLVQAGHRHGRTLSINWPLWAEGGMSVDAEVRERMRRQGYDLLGTADALAALYAAWAVDAAQVLVLAGDIAQLEARISPHAAAAAPPVHHAAGKQPVVAALPAHTGPVADDLAGPQALLPPLLAALTAAISRLLKVKAEQVDVDADISEFGFDSISLTALGNELNRTYGLELSPTIFFEYATVREFATHLAHAHGATLARHLLTRPPAAAAAAVAAPAAAAPHRRFRGRDDGAAAAASPQVAPAWQPATPAAREPIAIVGMSGRFPGARDLDEFWSNLAAGRDGITEIPPDRWDWRALYGDPHREANKTHIKWGGFIEGVDEFDPLFFGIAPKEAEMMDPQQRLLMMYGWKAIEDAGYAPRSLSGSQTGVFVGTAGSGYGELIARAKLAIEGYSSTGVAASIGPNRISYLLNLHGPSEPIETACSSSLVAIHRAIRAMESGDCDAALAGGVNTIITPWAHISFSKAGMLSEDGRCKTFSKHANGYVRGEGVGMLFLKRLRDAERDGDHIYAVIRGSAENHGGRANSLTAPNPKAQAALLKRAYREAQVDPRAVTYVEMHGTGTPLGDPIEINGLKSAFDELYAGCAPPAADLPPPRCGLGSVKTNIGHLELAAGVASVIKVVLQLRHRTLAPSLHGNPLNPHIELAGTPFYVVHQAQAWQPGWDELGRELPRTAGISSFGFGGANAHLIVEEYRAPQPIPQPPAAPELARPALVVLSARTAPQLAEQSRQLLAFLDAHPLAEADLPHLEYTLQFGRDAMEHRLAFSVRSVDALKHRLQASLQAPADGVDTPLHRGQSRKRREAPGAPGDAAVPVSDDAGREAVERCIAQAAYEPLLAQWVQGGAVSWAALQQRCPLVRGVEPHRLSLPTYPFERRRCWIAVEPNLGSQAAVPAVAPPPVGVVAAAADAAPAAAQQVSLRALCGSAWAVSDASASPPSRHGAVTLPGTAGGAAAVSPDIQDQPKRASVDEALRNFAINMMDLFSSSDATEPSLSDRAGELPAGPGGEAPFGAPSAPEAALARVGDLGAHRLRETLRHTLSPVLGVERGEIGDDDAFVELGLDSIMGVQWVRILNDRFGLDIDAVKVYEYPSVAALADYLAAEIERSSRGARPVSEPLPPGVASGGAAPAGHEAALPAEPATRFAHLLPPHDASGGAQAVPPPPAPPRLPVRQIRDVLRRTLSAVLGIDTADIADDAVFVDIGLDSIMAIQLIRAINSQFNLDLDAVRVYDHPSLEALAQHVASELAASPGAAPLMPTAGEVATARPGDARSEPVAASASGPAVLAQPGPAGPVSVYASVVRLQEVEPGIVQVTMEDRAHKNTFSPDLIAGLTEAFDAIARNDTCKVVVLTGYDTYFCCGGTKESLLDIQSGRVSFTDTPVFSIPLACPVPVIAAMQGHAIGAGWALAMFSDFVVFSRQGSYESNYMKYGFTPGAGATLIFPEKLGAGLAHEILFTARQFTGAELEQRRIPFPVVHRDEVLPHALALARTLCQSPRVALMALKEHVARPVRDQLQQACEQEVAMHRKTFVDSQDVLERVGALYAGGSRPISSPPGRGISAPVVQPPVVAPPAGPAAAAPAGQDRPAASAPAGGAPGSGSADLAIAIIGMSGAFANADSLDEFWRHLAEGQGCVFEVPPHRWSTEKFYDPDPDVPKKTYSKWMGALSEVDRFDPQFFNISRAEAAVIDPQQRLFLEHSWRCIEDAGLNPRSLSGSRCGVFVGCGSGDYAAYADLSAEGMMGNAPSILAARISYFLNLKGPCLALDTACSSALVAIAQACDSLLLGRSELAIAGGVNVLTGPGMHIMASKAGMLSKQGRCFTFDERADGFVPGEGVGVVLLKRYADALRDGDIVQGVIRGWGVNQDGKTNGITAPSVTSQIALEQEVYEQFGIAPDSITLVEAHGTGTGLGDPIEVQALTQAFRRYTDRRHYCALGSVKSNIGHLLAAAGIAGVMKVLLAMRHRTLPPTVNFEQLNSRITLEGSPFYINTQAREWQPGGAGVRRAAVSSFGFSGTNAHLVIEEPPVQEAALPEARRSVPVIVVLSAKQADRLKDVARRLLDHLASNAYDDAQLVDLAYTLQVGRDAMECRLAFVATSVQEVRQKLSDYLEGRLEQADVELCWQGEIGRHKEVMAVLNADGGLDTLIAGWLEQGRYASLLELWVQGLSFDWRRLYGEGSVYGPRRPRRLRLPTYPFARERCWPKAVPEIAVGYAFDAQPAAPLASGAVQASRPPEPALPPLAVQAPAPAGLPDEADQGLAVKPRGISLAELGMSPRSASAPEAAAPAMLAASPVPLHEVAAPAPVDAPPASQAHQAPSAGDLIVELAQSLAEVLYLESDDVDIEAAFSELGLDSVTGVGWIRELNQRYHTSLSASQLYDYPNVKALAKHLLTQDAVRTRAVASSARGTAHTAAEPLPPVGVAGLATPTGAGEHRQAPASASAARPAATRGADRAEAPATSAASMAAPPAVQAPPAPQAQGEAAGAGAYAAAGGRAERGGEAKEVRRQGIAVVGMSGAFPMAGDVQAFWENLAQGRDCVSEVGGHRWSIQEHYDADPQAPGKTYSKWMGSLEEADRFDALFFNISPAEAMSMDPQQRVFLEHSWRCIEEAGIDPRSLSGSRCGVYVGCGPGDYGYAPGGSGLTAQVLTGNSSSILSARISYFLNLRGPCMALDTACSSSLVAIALACDSLESGTCDAALAGGVCVLTGPSLHIMTSKARMLSRQGRSFAFDARADGFVPGEGVGVLLLKRYADAVREGDQIHGVIRGWGVNHDGKTNGMTAPSVNSQAQLEREVYERFGIDPGTITLVEAHGTGTQLGDPIEVEALTAAFGAYTQRRHYCALGSVKSNIGHLLAAAGVAGVIKVLLSLRHRMLPPTIQYEKLNEHVVLEGGPFYINDRLQPWETGGQGARRAAVSSFGFSGTNAHVVIEEPEEGERDEAPVVVVNEAQPGLLVLSARSEERLQAQARQLQAHLQAQAWSEAQLAQMLYTLQSGREAMEHRLAVQARTREQLVQALGDFIGGRRNADVQVGRVQRTAEGGWLSEQDEDVGALIEAWVRKQRWKKLGEAWVRGVQIDWRRLYAAGRPRRISLPTYPFLRERYWLPSAGTAQPQGSEAAADLARASEVSPDRQAESLPAAAGMTDRVATAVAAVAEKPRRISLLDLSATPAEPRLGELPPVAPPRPATADGPPAAAPVPRPPAPGADTSRLEADLCDMLSDTLLMRVTAADCEKPFSELGVDSIIGLEWIQAVNRRYGINITASVLYQHASIRRFTHYLAQQLGDDGGADGAGPQHPAPRPPGTTAPRAGDRAETRGQHETDGEVAVLSRPAVVKSSPNPAPRVMSALAADSSAAARPVGQAVAAVPPLQRDASLAGAVEHDVRTVRCLRASDSATTRLLLFYCLAHGEGSYQWVDRLAPHVEVWGVGTTEHTDWRAMVGHLADSIRALFDKPVVAWGHCMGGIAAFDVLCDLEQRHGLTAKAALLSSSCTPDVFESLKYTEPFRDLDTSIPDEELEQLFVESNLIFPKSWGMKIVSPAAIRNDVALIRSYRSEPGKRISTPLEIVQAKDDLLMKDPMLFARWRQMTTASCRYQQIEGTHLFFISPLQSFVDFIADTCLTAPPNP